MCINNVGDETSIQQDGNTVFSYDYLKEQFLHFEIAGENGEYPYISGDIEQLFYEHHDIDYYLNLKLAIAEALQSLPEKLSYIIKHRYGIGGSTIKSFRLISQDLGLNIWNIVDGEYKALQKMRAHPSIRALKK